MTRRQMPECHSHDLLASSLMSRIGFRFDTVVPAANCAALSEAVLAFNDTGAGLVDAAEQAERAG